VAKKLGKVKKPAAKKFKKGRKLFFLPLVFTRAKPEPDFQKLLDKYWQQAQAQINNLEEKLAQVKKVYHEWIADSGEAGVKAIEALDTGSKQIVKGILEKEAELQPIEDGSLLNEFMDWSRCLSVGLVSKKVFAQVYQSYVEVQKKRHERIAQKIDETLKSDEIGLLVMMEGHQVQFPSDIQVFYIAPPALDEIRRWLREKKARPKG
jgi:Fe2+ transport system protein B